MVLLPSKDSFKAGITILLIVTISGNPSSPSVAEKSSKDTLVNTIHPGRGPSHPSTSFAFDRHSFLHPTVQSEKMTDSESFTQINIRSTQAMHQPLGTMASIATDAVKGLTSAMSNLEEMILNLNLLVDVSDTGGRLIFAELTHHIANL